jgi:hypothetical protein
MKRLRAQEATGTETRPPKKGELPMRGITVRSFRRQKTA